MKLMLRNWRQGCIALLLFGASVTCVHAALNLSENRAKAAYVLNFVRLIDWPESAFSHPRAALVVCLVGDDELYASLAMLEGRLAHGRPLKVRHANRPERLADCHAVFISRSEEKRLGSILHHLDRLAVLTVSDIDGFIDAGGAIGLVRNEERLEFEVNREALQRAGLSAGSDLLKLARNLAAPRRGLDNAR